jgi:hypothetical protein
MRVFARIGVGLCLLVCCTRPPSALPLGGEEWVPEARHVDRRAPDEPRAEEIQQLQKRGRRGEPRVVAPAAETRSEPKTVAGETAFGFAPLRAGMDVTLRTKYTIRATLSASSADGGSSQSIEVDAAEKIAIHVASANEAGVREIDVEYVESLGTFLLDGAPNEEDSNAGKRYGVVFSGTDAKVTRKGGTLEEDEDRAVLFDLATVTGYLPLVKPHLPHSLAPGFRLRLEHKDLRKAFGSEDDVEFEGSELVLRGRALGDDKVALFDCKLPARFEKDGIALRVELTGTVSVRTADARPLDVRLKGPLGMADGAVDAGTLSGHVSVEFSHEYAAQE